MCLGGGWCYACYNHAKSINIYYINKYFISSISVMFHFCGSWKRQRIDGEICSILSLIVEKNGQITPNGLLIWSSSSKSTMQAPSVTHEMKAETNFNKYQLVKRKVTWKCGNKSSVDKPVPVSIINIKAFKCCRCQCSGSRKLGWITRYEHCNILAGIFVNFTTSWSYKLKNEIEIGLLWLPFCTDSERLPIVDLRLKHVML